MKKKLVSILLCGAMVFSLAGCGKSESKNVLDQVKDAGVLKVSVSPDFAPYEFEDPTKTGQDAYVGADMELARYIAKEMGVKLEIVPMDFDACLAAVTQGKVDVSISAFYPSEERKQTVDFTDAYFDDSRQCVVIKKDDADQYQTAEDFKGTKIAAQNGSAQATIAEEQIEGSELQLVSKTTDGVQMVKSGKVAGIVLQGVMAESIVAGDDSLAIAKPEFTYDESELVVAVKKGESEFVKQLNDMVKTVNDQKLYDQWLVDAQNLAASVTTD